MANRYPLILDTTDGNKLKELPEGDSLYLRNSSISEVQDINALGTINAAAITVNGESILSAYFLGLSDTPNSYSGAANTLVKVNSNGTGLVFAPFSDFGDITLDDVTINSSILPDTTDVSDIGSEILRFNDVYAVSFIGSLRGDDGTLVFDGSTNQISYAAIVGAPTDLGEFTNDAGYITANSIPSQTETSHLEVTERYTLGSPIIFTKVVGVDEEDEIDTDLTLARDPTSVPGNGGIYNSEAEELWDARVSPAGLLWNWDGWDNLDTVKNRQYVNFRQALKNRIGENVIGAELVAHDTINDKYYTFQFTVWTQGAEHDGLFAYTRRLVDISSTIGVTFADGTNLVTAPERFSKYPQTYVGDTSAYTLVLEDAGKHVYAFGVTITIPSRLTVDYPIGSFIKIVAENQDVTLAPVAGVSISSATSTAEENGSWVIPANSIATLIKTRQGTSARDDVWRLSVPPKNTANIIFTDTTISAPANADLNIESSNDVNIITSVDNENNTFEFKNDGTFYMAKNTVNDRSYISTPRNDTAGIMLITSANEVIIAANEADAREWTFGADGSLTFPDDEIQTTAYAGGQGHMFMIDTNRTDTYTEVGTADKPFKTFAAAIAAAELTNDTTFSFVLMGCTVTENVSFANTSFTQITISTSCRSVIDGDITITDVPAMSQMFFRNIEVGGTFTITGDGTLGQFNSVNFYNTSFGGPVNITATNATAFYEVAFFNEVNFTNINYTYINGAQFNTDWNISVDDNATIPSSGITPCIILGFNFIANNVFMIKNGAGSGFLVFQPHMSRMGLGAGVYNIPTNFIFQPQGCAIRGEWTNNGSTTLRNSSFDKAILGTSPVYTGIIGGDRVIVDGVPASSVGAAGDRSGMITSDGNYLYICTADYTDGLSDIWSRTSLSASNW